MIYFDAPDGGIATTIPTPGPDAEGYRPDEAGEVSKYGGRPAPRRTDHD